MLHWKILTYGVKVPCMYTQIQKHYLLAMLHYTCAQMYQLTHTSD